MKLMVFRQFIVLVMNIKVRVKTKYLMNCKSNLVFLLLIIVYFVLIFLQI